MSDCLLNESISKHFSINCLFLNLFFSNKCHMILCMKKIEEWTHVYDALWKKYDFYVPINLHPCFYFKPLNWMNEFYYIGRKVFRGKIEAMCRWLMYKTLIDIYVEWLRAVIRLYEGIQKKQSLMIYGQMFPFLRSDTKSNEWIFGWEFYKETKIEDNRRSESL